MSGISWYLVPGWAAAMLGVGLILIGLLGRRILVRRSPRCVACGYRLDGVPVADRSVRCPECGRVPRTAAEPHALGRKPWMVAVGVLVLIAGMLLPSVPLGRAQGWRAVLPLDVQVRMLRLTDDADTWSRVAAASAAGGLSEGSNTRLRASVKERLLDPSRDPTPAVGAAGILRRWTGSTRPELFDRDELARIAAEGAPPARSYAINELGGMAPPTPEQAEQRRMAWPQAVGRDRYELLKWIARYPAGPQDLDILRAAFVADPWQTSMFAMDEVIRFAPPEVIGVVVGLLDDPDPQLRTAGVMCFEDWLSEDEKPPLEIQRKILEVALNDPGARVMSTAARSIEDYSPELGPEISEALATTTRPELVKGLLYALSRRDDPSVLPGVERAALQPERPIEQRLEIALAFGYISARTRQPRAEAKFQAIYTEVVDGLIAGDQRLMLAMGRQSQLAFDELFLVALSRRIGADAVTTDGLNAWFAAHPSLAVVLEEAAPGTPDHAAAFRALFEQVRLRTNMPHDTAVELWNYIRLWFADLEELPG